MWIDSKIVGCGQKRVENMAKRGAPAFVMSRSQLMKFCLDKDTNPAKWIAGYGLEDETTSAMNFGSLLDCLTTTPEEFESKFAVMPATYPATPKKKGDAPEDKPWSRNANFCKDWEAEQVAAGKMVISQKMLDDAKLALNGLQSAKGISDLLKCSKRQVLIVATWHDEATDLNIPVAALLDLVPPKDNLTWGKTLADLKTARNGNPATWNRVCDDSGYDVQAALYMDLFIAATHEDRTDFVHVVQENEFPFHVTTPPPAMSTEFLDWGRQKYKKALRLYAQCLKTGVWPSYPQVGMTFGNTQIIDPKDCWNYKKCAGMIEFKNPETPATKTIGDDLMATA